MLVAVNARTERVENIAGMLPSISQIVIVNSPPAGS
jgi:hypothetical protein